MAFRATFDCLWCGAHHVPRGLNDIEGWAHLCPDCVGRAGDNAFLRFRLKRALEDRSAAVGAAAAGATATGAAGAGAAAPGAAAPGSAAAGATAPGAGAETPPPVD